MDRRTALKQLAAGGAIAAGGSLVLSSNAVAQTCSPRPDLPATPFDVRRTNGNRPRGRHVLRPNSTVELAGANSITYTWSIESYSAMGRNRAPQVRSRPGNAIITTGPTSDTCTSGCPTGPFAGRGTQFDISSSNIRNVNRPAVNFRNSNTYSIRVVITWEFVDCEDIAAEYVVAATWPSLPTVSGPFNVSPA